MELIKYITIVYFAAINLAAFLLTATDKVRAMRHERRIRERTLFIVALLGGAFVMYLSMLLCNHKTRHKRFMIGLPAIFVVQFVAAYFILF